MTVHNVLHSFFDDFLADKCTLASKIHISSRTDAGVHALANTAHVDLQLNPKFREQAIEKSPAREWFSEEAHEHVCADIRRTMNQLFVDQNFPIRWRILSSPRACCRAI